MKYDDETLRWVFDRTNGRCHLCGKFMCFSHYGGQDGWQIDHSKARAIGGTDHRNNLFPAHAKCNREKGTRSARAVRQEKGIRRSPISAEQIAAQRTGNAVAGAAMGAVGLGLLLGPAGVLIGGFLGGAIGHDMDPEADNEA